MWTILDNFCHSVELYSLQPVLASELFREAESRGDYFFPYTTVLCSLLLVKTTDRSTELVCCALSSKCYSFGFFVHKIETHLPNLNFPPKTFFVKKKQEENTSIPTLLCSVPYYWLVKTMDWSTELVCCVLLSQCYSFSFFVHNTGTHFPNLNFRTAWCTEALVTVLIFWFSIYRLITW